MERIDALVGLEIAQAVHRGFVTYSDGSQLWEAWCGSGGECMALDLTSPIEGEGVDVGWEDDVWFDEASTDTYAEDYRAHDYHDYDYCVPPTCREDGSPLDAEYLSLRIPMLV